MVDFWYGTFLLQNVESAILYMRHESLTQHLYTYHLPGCWHSNQQQKIGKGSEGDKGIGPLSIHIRIHNIKWFCAKYAHIGPSSTNTSTFLIHCKITWNRNCDEVMNGIWTIFPLIRITIPRNLYMMRCEGRKMSDKGVSGRAASLAGIESALDFVLMSYLIVSGQME